MLADILTEIIEQRFPGKATLISGEGMPFLEIKPEYEKFGTIKLFDDGDEVTIVFGNFTHSHYGNYEEISQNEKDQAIAEDVTTVLEDTFADRLEFWGSRNSCGGFREREGALKKRLFFKKIRLGHVWSRPPSKNKS